MASSVHQSIRRFPQIVIPTAVIRIYPFLTTSGWQTPLTGHHLANSLHQNSDPKEILTSAD
jgi:hypothetical protein